MSWSNFVHRSAVEVRPHRQRARRRWTPQTHHLRMGPWRISLRPHSLSRRISLKLLSLPHSQHLENLGPLESSQRCSPRPSQLEVAVISIEQAGLKIQSIHTRAEACSKGSGSWAVCGCHQVSEGAQETMCWAERVEHTKCLATVGNENAFLPGQSYLNLFEG